MAGGEGTRLRPLTSNAPKPMLPLVNRPMMEHIVDLLRRHDIDEIVVTVAFMANSISTYFGDGSEFGVHMVYATEESPLGTAGSVRNAKEHLDERFEIEVAVRFGRFFASRFGLTIVVPLALVALGLGERLALEGGHFHARAGGLALAAIRADGVLAVGELATSDRACGFRLPGPSTASAARGPASTSTRPSCRAVRCRRR